MSTTATAGPAAAHARREAWMRKVLRAEIRALPAGGRIAVVCGAWHAPALVELGPARPQEVRQRAPGGRGAAGGLRHGTGSGGSRPRW